jgi:hypothetical protein
LQSWKLPRQDRSIPSSIQTGVNTQESANLQHRLPPLRKTYRSTLTCIASP